MSDYIHDLIKESIIELRKDGPSITGWKPKVNRRQPWIDSLAAEGRDFGRLTEDVDIHAESDIDRVVRESAPKTEAAIERSKKTRWQTDPKIGDQVKRDPRTYRGLPEPTGRGDLKVGSKQASLPLVEQLHREMGGPPKDKIGSSFPKSYKDLPSWRPKGGRLDYLETSRFPKTREIREVLNQIADWKPKGNVFRRLGIGGSKGKFIANLAVMGLLPAFTWLQDKFKGDLLETDDVAKAIVKEDLIELRKDNHWDITGWEREPSTKQNRVGGFQYEAEGSEKSKPKIIDESWKRSRAEKRIPSWKKVLRTTGKYGKGINPKKLAALLAAAGIGAGVERLGGGERAKELYDKAKEIIPFWNADMENAIVKEVVSEFLQK